MKTKIVLLMVLSFAIAAQAVVLVEEGFDYAEGTSVMGQGGGTGFAAGSTWSSDADGTLTMEDFGGGNIRPHMVPSTGTTLSGRNLATPLAEVGNYWVGVTLDIDDQIATRFYVLNLRGSGADPELGCSSQLEWFLNSGGVKLTGVSTIDDGSGGNPGPVRLVVNLDMVVGEDTFKMWVVDEGEAIDPAAPLISGSAGTIGNIDYLRLGAGTGNGSTSFTASGLMDDIVIGTEVTDVVDIKVASGPDPADGEINVKVDLSARVIPGKLSWTAPGAYTPDGYDIYFGTTEPNDLLADYGLTQIGTAGQADTSVAPTLPLTNLIPYYWVVDSREPNVAAPLGYDLHRGVPWSFTTIPLTPVIDTPPVGDVGTSVDLLIEATNPEVYEWYRAGDPNVLVQTTGTLGVPGPASDTYTATAEGYYYCVVTNGAGSVTSDTVLVLNPRKLAHWTLDTDATDSSGNGYDGTNVGATATTGVIGGAFEFVPDAGGDPNAAHVDLTAHVDTLLTELEQGTIIAWFKTDTVSDALAILSAYDTTQGSTEARLFIEGDGTLRWDIRIDGVPSDAWLGGPDRVDDNEWHMAAVVIGPDGQGTMYLDGLAIDTNAQGFFSSIDTYDGMAIGRNVDNVTAPAGQWHFDGLLDDIQIHTNPMTAYEVADLYTPVAGPICVNPGIMTYDLNDDCEVNLTDLSMLAGDWLKCGLYPTCTTVIP